MHVHMFGLTLGLMAQGLFATVPMFPRLADVKNIYTIESGFDSNDVVELLITGTLPDSCHQLGEVKTIVDDQTKHIDVVAKAFQVKRDVCLEMVIPFTEVVKVGVLNTGSYTVSTPSNHSLKASLKIAEAPVASRDNYLYAPVEDVRVVAKSNASKVDLHGRFPLSKRGCMYIERVEFIPNYETHVLVIQPIAGMSYASTCTPEKSASSYDYSHVLPDLPKGEWWIHTRSLGGRSYNKLVTIE